MTIKRLVNGEVMEFELTLMESRDVYQEYQHKCDIEDIETYFDGYANDDDFMADWNITLSEAEQLYDRMAYRYRKYRDNDEQWTYDRDAAVSDIIGER